MRRFAVGLSLSSGLIGLLMMINVDVSARRLVYISISLALLTGALWDALWRTRDHIWSSRKAILTWALLAHAMFYLVAVGLWMGRISHTGENASRAPGSIVPPGAYVLGADAAAQGYFNETRPIFWSPKNYLFANHDESAIQRDYNPEYMVLNAIDLQKLRQGKYSCGPFVKSFLDHEVARLPIYEYHESLTLGTDLIVLRRAP
ncbi:MAG: hypothetical protein K1Y02_01190 [Candidatus Hydrogenedentes bacterium]|nr:hypothetical protein [Candidatus Hydrogenedentota bacterium]